MFTVHAVSTNDGSIVSARGLTRRDAEQNILRELAREHGTSFVRVEAHEHDRHGAIAADFLAVPLETFAELPPRGNRCAVVCFPVNQNGKIGRCHSATNFSESKMVNFKKPRHRYGEDDDADVEQLRRQLTDLIENAPLALLQRIAAAVSEQDDEPQNAEEEKFCEALQSVMKFSEKKPLNLSQKDYLRAFRAERRINPSVKADDWFPQQRR